MKYNIDDKICIKEAQLLDFLRKNIKYAEYVAPSVPHNIAVRPEYNCKLFGHVFSLVKDNTSKRCVYNLDLFLPKAYVNGGTYCIASLEEHDPVCKHMINLYEEEKKQTTLNKLTETLKDLKHTKELSRLKQEHKEQKSAKSFLAYIKCMLKR